MMALAALVIASGLTAIALVERARIPRPPLGHYNWRDLLLAMVFVLVMPYVYLAAHPLVATLVFALVWFAMLGTLLSSVMRWGYLVALVIVVGQAFLRSPWVGNFATVILGAGAGALFIRNGLRTREVAAFGIALMVYDYVFTRLVGQMMELFELLVQQPYFIGFIVGELGLGGGDVLLMGIFVADFSRHAGRWAGLLALAFALPLLIPTTLFAAWAETGIPYLIIATPIYLAALACCWCIRRARPAGRQRGMSPAQD